MDIKIFNMQGEETGKMKLPKEMFEVEVKPGLIHQALTRQMANARHPIAHTLEKGEVRGGGRKPYRQKGTGRARQGSIRNPHYKGGGVAFGPKNTRNFMTRMPKKQRRTALFMTLSVKANENKIFALDKYEDKDTKTKNASIMIKKLPVERNILFVVTAKDNPLKRVTNNLINAQTILVNYLNPRDLVNYDSLCFVGEALDKAKEIFLKSKK